MIFNTKGSSWSWKEIKTLLRYYNEGRSYKDISQVIGRSIPACSTKIHNIRMGVHIINPAFKPISYEEWKKLRRKNG